MSHHQHNQIPMPNIFSTFVLAADCAQRADHRHRGTKQSRSHIDAIKATRTNRRQRRFTPAQLALAVSAGLCLVVVSMGVLVA